MLRQIFEDRGLEIPLLSAPHRRLRHARQPHDLNCPRAISRRQHDASPPHELLAWCVAVGAQNFNLGAVGGAKVKADVKASHAGNIAHRSAIGRSRGGLTTNIVALVDALGNLVRLLLLPGQAHDMKVVAPLIRGVSFDALLADKAFDADWLLQDLDESGATAVIPPKANRKIQHDYDVEVYKWLHLVENYHSKIKEFRGVATRYDKTDCSYTASCNLAATLVASR